MKPFILAIAIIWSIAFCANLVSAQVTTYTIMKPDGTVQICTVNCIGGNCVVTCF